MPHPIMFDDDDPYLARVRSIALSYPEAAEKIGHGRPGFFTARMFCHYGGSQRIDGQWVRHDQAVLFHAGEDPVLRADDQFWVPAYLGPHGWLGMDLAPDTDWTLVRELIDESYRHTAAARLVRLLPD